MKNFRECSDTEEALPIHTGMFERHRVRSLKMLLSDVLTAEISYHCRAVEELSLVLSSLTEIKEEQATE
jgi:hypothetical protein